MNYEGADGLEIEGGNTRVDPALRKGKSEFFG
jgi:hypothetical protein